MKPTACYPLDFCGNKELHLAAHDGEKLGPLVTLRTEGTGPVSFQWSMTPTGARAMAAMLLMAADEAEQMAAPEQGV